MELPRKIVRVLSMSGCTFFACGGVRERWMLQSQSVETIRSLTERFEQAKVHRAMRVARYDAGTRLVYDVTAVAPSRKATVTLTIEKFVGGGFAGQVYRAKVEDIEAPDGPLEGIEIGGTYAIKILLPASNRARVFRDLLYQIGFQGPFALQCNPSAARAGAIWWKLIRRAARIRFGDELSVVDVLATFVDPVLGSCGEISEWIEGRTWRYEVDDRLFARWRWKVREGEGPGGSPEYCAKKAFMVRFVELMHEVGARELARQYEWWTCKSQPNVLKRVDTEDDPQRGLTGVDFRAGLTLLPLLPMLLPMVLPMVLLHLPMVLLHLPMVL